MEAGEIERERGENGDDGWGEDGLPRGVAKAGQETYARGPKGEFNAEGEGEEDAEGAVLDEEGGDDGDGDEAVVLQSGGDAEGAAALAFPQPEQRRGEVGDDDAEDDEPKAETRRNEDRQRLHDVGIADDTVEDERGGEDVDDQPHEAFVRVLSQDAQFSRRSTERHREIDGQDDGEDRGVAEHGGCNVRRAGEMARVGWDGQTIRQSDKEIGNLEIGHRSF